MSEMVSYIKEIDKTFFYKRNKTTIADVAPGDIVCIKVQNPLHYGARDLTYFGRIEKITRCYFWVIEYCGPVSEYSSTVTDCSTDFFNHANSDPGRLLKKWAKTSLLEIWEADTESRVVETTIWKSK